MNMIERMYYVLGMVKAYAKTNENYRTVNLGQYFGTDCRKYEIGTLSDGITLFDNSKRDAEGARRIVIQISEDFDVMQMRYLLLEALAFERKNS